MEHIIPPLLSSPLGVLIVLLAMLHLKYLFNWSARMRGLPFPPGPTPLPLIGNLFSMGKSKPWLAHRDLCTKYGDIIYLRVLGQSMIVLGSPTVIFEYLDKRSAITSDRKQSPMIELSGSRMNFAFLPYGQWWRRHRRAFWQHFHREAALEHRPVEVAFAHRFIARLLNDPTELVQHVRHTFLGTVMKVCYDIDIDKTNVDYLKIVDEAIEGPSQGLVPGRFLVEFLPFLRHIPTWFPGAYSQRLFAKWIADSKKLADTPFNHSKESLSLDSEPRAVIEKLLRKAREDESALSLEEEEEIIKDVGMVSIEAGSDTTFSTLQSMFLAMSLHSDVLKKAHAELDAVVGPHRLPDFDHFDSLVYIQAIVKESLRWHNVLPLGLPHTTTRDSEIRGYLIPAGTVILPNTWACMHDLEVYEDPDEFRPERFIRDGKIDTAVRDPSAFVFGFGRRICPGRYFAEAGLFINMASALHVFDISPPIGENGLPIKIQHMQTDGFLSYPEDCRCTIRPRSAQAKALIQSHAPAAYCTGEEKQEM